MKNKSIETTLVPGKLNRFGWRKLLMLTLMLVAVYVFLPQIENFKQSYNALTNADWRILLIAFLFSISTSLCSTFIYKLLAVHPIPYFKSLLVQIASGFNNRVLPAGLGALATNASYLVKEGHTNLQAASVAGLNNLVGFIGNLILIVFFVVFSKTPLNKVVAIKLPSVVTLVILMAFVAIIVTLIAQPKLRIKITKIVKALVLDLKILTKHPLKMALALFVSMIMTILGVLTLYACSQAVGANLSLVQIFFVFSIGILAGALTPTPGGIGGAEAGLVAAFVSVGVTSDLALAIALVFRFFVYWFPILPGFIAFQYCMRKEYI